MRLLFSCVAGVVVLALAQTAHAWDCEFRADRAGAVDTAGVQKIVLRTGAGDLKVTGREGARIEAKGEACASTQELLDAMTISVRREGTTAFVETVIPVEKMKAMRQAYAYIDRIRDVASVKLEDSSGDVTIEKVAGPVDVVSDSSGDLLVRDIGGQVDIRQDSSGDIRAEDVRGSVIVGVDSSGSIYARNVTGDFTVEADASGSIEHEKVKGRISTPDNK